MTSTYDVIVLGAGAMGSAAAYHLAKSGVRVLLLEQFEIDHQKGSSYGYSRIIRYAYEHPAYIRLMKAAYPAWHAFEEEAGEKLYTRTGGLDFGRPSQSSLQRVITALTETNIPFDSLSPAEAAKHFPQFRFDEDMQIIYQADAGILSASKCVRAHVRLAEQHSATIMPNTPVTAITPRHDGVTVTTANAVFEAAHLIVTAGSWAKSVLADIDLTLSLTPLRCQEVYFDTDNPLDYQPDRFPTFIAHMLDVYQFMPYGIASHDNSGLKIGFHGGQPVNHPSEIDYTPDSETAELSMTFARKHIPGVTAHRASRVCLYTMTPDEDFLIDKHPEYPHIVIGAGFSGHGFKFSTLIGTILADLALHGTTNHDISLFRLSRFL